MKRIQFEMSDDKSDELDKLMETINVSTKRELFNNALTLLEWAVKEVADERIVGSISDDGSSYRELAMPIFSAAKAAKAAEDKRTPTS